MRRGDRDEVRRLARGALKLELENPRAIALLQRLGPEP